MLLPLAAVDFQGLWACKRKVMQLAVALVRSEKTNTFIPNRITILRVKSARRNVVVFIKT